MFWIYKNNHQDLLQSNSNTVGNLTVLQLRTLQEYSREPYSSTVENLYSWEPYSITVENLTVVQLKTLQ